MKSNNGHWNTWRCDNCLRIIYIGGFICVSNHVREITRKGTHLHYCSEECYEQHRGKDAGNGRKWPPMKYRYLIRSIRWFRFNFGGTQTLEEAKKLAKSHEYGGCFVEVFDMETRQMVYDSRDK